jgi:hypothetical protein
MDLGVSLADQASSWGSSVSRLASICILVAVLIPREGIANIEQARSWLSGNQREDGAISSDSDITPPYQGTVDAVLAHDLSFGGVGVDRSAAAGFVAGVEDTATEVLARKLSLFPSDNSAARTLLAEILSHQNDDGGFGAYKGYQSSVIDTAAALAAISRYRSEQRTAAGRALQFLLGHQRDDGGFALSLNEQSSPALTAIIIIALHNYAYDSSAVSQSVSAAARFLLQNYYLQGSSLSDWQLALDLLAIIPLTTDGAVYADILEDLRSRQLAEGSWLEDVYTTSISIKALELAGRAVVPPSYGLGALDGKVIDASSGQPVPGVRVVLSGEENEVQTDGLGRFRFAQIQEGAHTISLTAAGYYSQRQEIQLGANEIRRIADISLHLIPQEAQIHGYVSDEQTQAGLQAANITLNNADDQYRTATGVQGYYRLAVTADQYDIQAGASGYEPSLVNVRIPVGASMTYSPSLSREGERPEDTAALVNGRIIDSVRGFPLFGAVIDAGGIFAFTDIVGRFELTLPDVNLAVLRISRSGYRARQESIILASGQRHSLGEIPLVAVEVPLLPNTLQGIITDRNTGSFIASATVAIEETGQTSSSLADGSYLLETQNASRITVRYSAPGYFSQRITVHYEAPGVVREDIRLVPMAIDGLLVERLDTDKTNYPAFHTADIAGAVINAGTSPRSLRLVLQVLDQHGATVATLPLTGGTGGEMDASPLFLAAGERYEFATSWFTGISAPGGYSIRMLGFDSHTQQKLLEESHPIEILPTTNMPSLVLQPDKTHIHAGKTEIINLRLNATNRSNITVSTDIHISGMRPDGTEFDIKSADFTLLPKETWKLVELGTFEFIADSPGDYVLSAVVEGFDVEPAIISVAPVTRIDATQQLIPDTVAPGDARRVRIDINLQGMDQ